MVLHNDKKHPTLGNPAPVPPRCIPIPDGSQPGTLKATVRLCIRFHGLSPSRPRIRWRICSSRVVNRFDHLDPMLLRIRRRTNTTRKSSIIHMRLILRIL